MRAGALNKRIEIHSFTESQDGFGQSNKTYALLKTVWAGVKQITGSETETGGKHEGRMTYEFTIRNTAITRNNRIVWNGLNFEIEEINNVLERNAELKIRAFSDG